MRMHNWQGSFLNHNDNTRDEKNVYSRAPQRKSFEGEGSEHCSEIAANLFTALDVFSARAFRWPLVTP